jgi:hypothetical protein
VPLSMASPHHRGCTEHIRLCVDLEEVSSLEETKHRKLWNVFRPTSSRHAPPAPPPCRTLRRGSVSLGHTAFLTSRRGEGRLPGTDQPPPVHTVQAEGRRKWKERFWRGALHSLSFRRCVCLRTHPPPLATFAAILTCRCRLTPQEWTHAYYAFSGNHLLLFSNKEQYDRVSIGRQTSLPFDGSHSIRSLCRTPLRVGRVLGSRRRCT